jgi:Cd2+/Zn2+-exporting ATPase
MRLPLADAGMAMGFREVMQQLRTVDIQNDQPYKIFTAANIGKQTKKIVWQTSLWHLW